MKKLLLTSILLAVVVVNSNGQTQPLVSKKGEPILPQAKDWSIGFDVVPIFKAVGNLFHSSADESFSQEDNTLVALYMKNATTAYRARLRIGYHSTMLENKVPDDTYTGSGTAVQLTDSWTQNRLDVTLGFGIQKSKGKGRLRGIYGGEVFLMFGTNKNSYSYANKFSQTVQTPNSTAFDSLISPGVFYHAPSSSRLTTNNQGSGVGFGVDGFLGAEYFFAPKISVSAEYLWGFSYVTVGEGTLTTEQLNAANTGSDFVNSKSGKASTFGLDVQNAASIILHVYF